MYLKKYRAYTHRKIQRSVLHATRLYRAERGPGSAKKSLFREWMALRYVDASLIEQMLFGHCDKQHKVPPQQPKMSTS